MKKAKITYLDNAATTYPKPERVLSEASDCMKNYCGNSGRGSHELAMRAAQKIYECRVLLGDMFGASPERVIFTMNTTYAINMAIKGALSPGDHVLISNFEHNSVWRVLEKMRQDGQISYDIFDALTPYGILDEESIILDIERKIQPQTRMIFCNHSSNICSYTLPLEKIGDLCHRHKLIFGVDAAQSAGHEDINMRKLGIDLLCLPSHKGLYGPQGCGVLILGDRMDISTLVEGGNGISSLIGNMGEEYPERLEAGTLSTPSIAGLCEGIRQVRTYGLANIRRHDEKLWRIAEAELSRIRRIHILAPESPGAILSFYVDGVSSDRIGELLSRDGFCVRTGFHCAALAHRALGTPDSGCVRISFGIFNTTGEVEGICVKIRELIKGECAKTRE